MGRLAAVAAVCLGLVSSTRIAAQVSDADSAHMLVRATVALGGSIFQFDENPFRGLAARGGLALGRLADLTLGLERWPDLDPYSGWALQAEASFYPLGRTRLAPYVLFHVGHFWATAPSGSFYSSVGGRTTGLAVGVLGLVADPFGIRAEALVRYDAGLGDAQLRALVTYAPGQSQARIPAEASAILGGMVPLSGPWHFVEPAYAVEFATKVSERYAAALTLALLHWRISEPRRNISPYLWDTRAVLVMPAWRRSWESGAFRWYLQAGPSASLMFEGPDFGFRGGANTEVGGSLRLGSLPRLTGGVSWVWIVRGRGDPSVTATDQRSLLLHAGLTF